MPLHVLTVLVASFVVNSICEPSNSQVSDSKAFVEAADANGWKQVRRAEPQETIELTFWVKQTHLDELSKLSQDVSNPKSPEYGHYQSKDEMDRLTAPTDDDIATVKEALRGYDVVTKSDGAIVSAVVPVSFATKLFGGAFVLFCRRDDARVCAMRNPDAHIPLALREACDIISPLKNHLQARFPGPIISGSTSSENLRTLTDLALDRSPARKKLGCCYSIGYGDEMLPCCLSTEHVANRSGCAVGERMGGATGYTSGNCPASALEAAAWLKDSRKQLIQTPTITNSDGPSCRYCRIVFVGTCLAAGALLVVVIRFSMRSCLTQYSQPLLQE